MVMTRRPRVVARWPEVYGQGLNCRVAVFVEGLVAGRVRNQERTRPCSAPRGAPIEYFTAAGRRRSLVENHVQQKAAYGAKSGLIRAARDAPKVRKIKDFAISGILATDQKVRSSNLFGRAIYPFKLANIFIAEAPAPTPGPSGATAAEAIRSLIADVVSGPASSAGKSTNASTAVAQGVAKLRSQRDM
jgi:hypothetical protein